MCREEEDKLGENETGKLIENGLDATDTPSLPIEAQRRVACLQRILARVEIEVHGEDGNDIAAEPLKTPLCFESVS